MRSPHVNIPVSTTAALKASEVAVELTDPTIPSPWGSLPVPPGVYEKWTALGSQRTANGTAVRDFLGFALQVVAFASGHGTAAYFERGMIVLRPDGRAFAVYGMIYARYRAFGDVVPTGWSPGLPTSDEQAVTGGRMSSFDGADIYWSSTTGAHEVHGAIRDHVAALGGCGGWLGFPLTDETSVRSGSNEIGRMNNFQSASIYWSGTTGAFEVHGALRQAWLERFGGPAGTLGWPVSDETGSPAGIYRFNDFQNGCLTWRAVDGLIQCFTSLDVYVDRFSSQGDHTVGEHFGASIWLFVNSSVTASTGQGANPSFPGGGNNYGDPNASPQASILTISPVRGDLVINASFTGYDHSPVQGDQNLGTVSGQFAIDALWGLNQPQEHWDPSNSFFVAYSVRNQSPTDPNDPQFRQDLFWAFENFDTATLSREQYAQTFVDVEVGESGFLHPFDELFYDLVYEGIAAGGNCFGMCLEANDTLARTSLYSEPLSAIGHDATTTNEINVKHGYQLGVDVVNYVVGKFVSGATHNPVQAFNESRDLFNSGNYPILSITSAYIGGDGHAVRPYAWDQSNPNDWTISIANPNRPPSRGGDTDPQNVIHVDPNANTFTFAFDSANTWTGGTWSGGRMYVLPFSVMCSEQNTPFWDVMLALLGAALIVLGGDGTTTQVTDDQGRTFYSPALTAPPTLWSDIAPDGPRRIPGMARIPLLASTPIRPPAVSVEKVTPEILAPVAAALSTAAAQPAPSGAPASGTPATRYAGRLVDTSFIANLLQAASVPEVYQLPIGLPFGATPAHATVSVTTSAIAGAANRETVAAAVQSPGALVGGEQGATATHVLSAAPSAREVATPGLRVVDAAPPGQLIHHVSGKATGSYQWGLRSPAASAVATVPTAAGVVDQIGIDRPGAQDQAVTVTLADGAAARAVTLHLAATTMKSAAAPNIFSLSNLTVIPGQPFTAGLSADGEALVLQNPGPAVTFALDVQQGGPAGLVASRPLVTVAAGQVATIRPTSWTPVQPAQAARAPLTMQIQQSPGGPVEHQLAI
jgi:hypothetical protein